jgi:hypothetical protein
MPCVLCHRQAKGFLWQSPKTQSSTRRETYAFCSFRCQRLFGKIREAQEERQRWLEEPEAPMIDATETEKAAMAAALRPLGDYVATLGMERPLADYSREEILTLVEIVIDAFQSHLLEVHERQAEREMEMLRRLDAKRSPMSFQGGR